MRVRDGYSRLITRAHSRARPHFANMFGGGRRIPVEHKRDSRRWDDRARRRRQPSC
jgi:hypothetical protein